MSNNVYRAMVKAWLVFARVYDNKKRLGAVRSLPRGGMGRDGVAEQTGPGRAKLLKGKVREGAGGVKT